MKLYTSSMRIKQMQGTRHLQDIAALLQEKEFLTSTGQEAW